MSRVESSVGGSGRPSRTGSATRRTICPDCHTFTTGGECMNGDCVASSAASSSGAAAAAAVVVSTEDASSRRALKVRRRAEHTSDSDSEDTNDYNDHHDAPHEQQHRRMNKRAKHEDEMEGARDAYPQKGHSLAVSDDDESMSDASEDRDTTNTTTRRASFSSSSSSYDRTVPASAVAPSSPAFSRHAESVPSSGSSSRGETSQRTGSSIFALAAAAAAAATDADATTSEQAGTSSPVAAPEEEDEEEEDEEGDRDDLADPVLARLYHAYTRPNLFARRMKANWSSMRALMPQAQALVAARRQKAESLKTSETLLTPSPAPHTRPTRDIAAAADTPAASPPTELVAELTADTGASMVHVKLEEMKEPPPAAAASLSPTTPKRDLRRLPTSIARLLQAQESRRVARRERRRPNLDPVALRVTRPNSCPPILVRHTSAATAAAAFDASSKAWPRWMQDLTSPQFKSKEREEKRGATPIKLYDEPDGGKRTTSDDNDGEERKESHDASHSLVHSNGAYDLPGFDAVGVPRPHVPLVSASAPSTPAVGGSFRDLTSSTSSHMQLPAWLTSRDPISELALFSPRAASFSVAIGSRPTSTRAPSRASVGSSDGTSLLPPRASIGASPRFSDSTPPQFGDSVLVTSIPSSTRPLPVFESSAAVAAAANGQPALARTFSLMSPVHRPVPDTEFNLVAAAPSAITASSPAAAASSAAAAATAAAHPTSPISPLASIHAATGATTPAATATGPTFTLSPALLQEWRVIGLTYVESHLKPPTLTALANATRQSRQVLAAALDRFLPGAQPNGGTHDEQAESKDQEEQERKDASGEATKGAEVKHDTTTTSMPTPMSPLPPRHSSLPIGSMGPQPSTPLLVRGASTPLSVAAAASATTPKAAAVVAPFSPNLSRMASFLHTSLPPLGASAVSLTNSNQAAPSTPTNATKTASKNVADEAAAPAVATQSGVAKGAETPKAQAPAASASHTSRVGTAYQAEIPALLTQKQRAWERSTYLHAHAAVHGFPRHLPPLPSAPTPRAGSSSSTSSPFIRVPLVPRAPYVLASFPASASLALSGRRSALRETLMGGRRAARRKAQKLEEEQRQRHIDSLGTLTGRRAGGRSSTNGVAGTGSSYVPPPPPYVPPRFPLTEQPPPNFNPADIWPWTWEEYRERELEKERRQIKALRDARKRNRDERRATGSELGGSLETGARASPHDKTTLFDAADGKFHASHPSFASIASLFPAGSALARMHLDDDTLSPYFVCASFERPPSPLQNVRVRSFSPVHVLSMPPTPLATSSSSLARFPSSLLEPSVFTRRVSSLARGVTVSDEEDFGDEEDDERRLAAADAKRRRDARRARARAEEDELPVAAEEEEEHHASSKHRPARTIKPTPRHAPPASSPPVPAPARKSKSGTGSGLAVAFGPNAGRFKRWKMVAGKRVVWWLDAQGNTVLGTPPDEDAENSNNKNSRDQSDEDDSSEHSDASDQENESDSASHSSRNSERVLIKRSRLPPASAASLMQSHNPYSRRSLTAPAPRQLPVGRTAAPLNSNDSLGPPAQLHMSNLSPSVRILSARTGIARFLVAMEEVFEDAEVRDLDDTMERHVGRWRQEEGIEM